MKSKIVLLAALVTLAVYLIGTRESWAKDDAMELGLKPSDFPELPIDLFAGMDGGKELTPEEIMGRNNWNAWTAGTQVFWDEVARTSFGLTDLLKTVDSRGRGQRFELMGLISDPRYRRATQPDEHGLWLDELAEEMPAGWNAEWEAVYGRSSGVMGLRLYPNPDFDAEAQKAWDAKRFYEDREYYTRTDLVRPYRVGMTCGFCHIAFDPLAPPADPEAPRMENLMSTIGNQYIREGPAFMFDIFEMGREFYGKQTMSGAHNSFFREMLALQPAGTSDTSRVATDHINNPNTINPIFNLADRVNIAVEEEMGDDRPHLAGPPIAAAKGPMARVPHVLKDGADSVGVPGATIRVFINIGMFSQYWLQLHDKLVGFGGQQPFRIEHARKSSVYWQATEERLGNIAAFLKTAAPLYLKDAPGGEAFITSDENVLREGAIAFANNCAECHSSKQPPNTIADRDSPQAKRWYQQSVLDPDFRVANFLSDDRRYPITRPGLKTNAARALGTNATRGNVWDNFSSETYKTLPAVGTIKVYDPQTKLDTRDYEMPGGGRGYYRTPSLVSIWTSAPLLHNNTLGNYSGDPSVAGRVRDFEDATAKLLGLVDRPGIVWRTQAESWLKIPEAALPQGLRDLLGTSDVFEDGTVLDLGPIPAGTPVNMLGSINTDIRGIGDVKDLAGLALAIKKALLRTVDMPPAEAYEVMRKDVAPLLMEASNCPDFIMDKGHTYGSELSVEKKRALIEFLKTL